MNEFMDEAWEVNKVVFFFYKDALAYRNWLLTLGQDCPVYPVRLGTGGAYKDQNKMTDEFNDV